MLDHNIAKAIIASLSSGAVSIKHVHHYDVGRSNQIQNVTREIENNSSKLRFVNGDYGTGKTHFLSSIRHWATENDYVPSHVVLSPRGTPLYNIPTVYSRIMKNLVINDEDLESPIEAVLEFIFQIFQQWIKHFLKIRRVPCEKFCMDPLYCYHCNRSGAIEKLYIEDFERLDARLRVAIVYYRSAKWGFNPDFETADLVVRWLEGEPVYRRELNYLGMWEDIIKNDILKGLGEIAKLVSLVGKKGMIIMLDEAEGIDNLTPHQKPIAYENLQFLIAGAKQFDNIYFLYATTPTFYNDVQSYSFELAETVNNTACTDLAPLTPTEIKSLISKVTQIYLAAVDISEDDEIKEIADEISNDYSANVVSKGTISVRDIITGYIKEFKEFIPV